MVHLLSHHVNRKRVRVLHTTKHPLLLGMPLESFGLERKFIALRLLLDLLGNFFVLGFGKMQLLRTEFIFLQGFPTFLLFGARKLLRICHRRLGCFLWQFALKYFLSLCENMVVFVHQLVIGFVEPLPERVQTLEVAEVVILKMLLCLELFFQSA